MRTSSNARQDVGQQPDHERDFVGVSRNRNPGLANPSGEISTSLSTRSG